MCMYKQVISLISELFTLLTSKCTYEEDDDQTESHLQHLYQVCYTFVKDKCADRDESHGLEHMVMVTYNGLDILKSIMETQIVTYYDIEDIIVGCMLHDVADHKYETPQNQLNQAVQTFLTIIIEKKITTCQTSAKHMWNILSTVSFSKEKKAGSLKTLMSPHNLPIRLLTIRNIISDADRLEAIGEIGAERCIKYTREMYPDKPLEFIKNNVQKHAHEKLYIMPFGDPTTSQPYFHTEQGQKKALILHENTCKYIQKFLNT